MDILKVVGRWIRELRKRQGLSQEELGEKTGLSSNYISLIERGHKQVTIVTLAGITEALGVNLEDVFEAFQVKTGSPVFEKELATLNNSLRNLRAEDIKVLRQMIDHFCTTK